MPLDLLDAFARKKAGKDELLRALCEYEKWFVPINVAQAAMSGRTFECLSVWGAQSKVPADKLYLFTDVEAGQRAAKKGPLGPYASPVIGAGLFSNLPDGFSEVHVNPGSEPEQSWMMGGDWVQLGRRWGAIVELERMLDGRVKGELGAALLAFEGFITFRKGDETIATFDGAGGMKHPAMVFTAPDCADAALQANSKEPLERVAMNGNQLFTLFPKLGVDGFIFNAFGPGPVKAFDEALCWGVLTAVANQGKT